MAHGVVYEKNLDTNDEYFVSLCQEEGGGGKCIGRRSDPILPFFVLAILLLQDRDALLFARARSGFLHNKYKGQIQQFALRYYFKL